MPHTQPITLQELVSLALPAEARVLAGPGSYTRPVSWVVSISATDQAARASTGDFIFLLPPYVGDLTPQLTRLARAGVTGVALVGEPPQAVVSASNQANLPLVSLPELADIRRIERSALSLILDKSAAIEEFAGGIYQQLNVLSADNAGLGAMADLIGRTTGRTVLIQDKRLVIIATWFEPDTIPLRQEIENWVTLSSNLPEELLDRKRAAQNTRWVEQPLPQLDLTRIIAPIVAKGMARGFLSLLVPPANVGAFYRSVAVKSAAACALEMAKAKAVSEAEKRVRGTFVDALLAGNLTPVEAARWAKRNRYNPDGQHCAMVVDWATKEHPSYRRLETVVHGLSRMFHAGLLAQALESEIVVFGRLESHQGLETARQMAEAIRRQAAAESPSDPLAIGIGRPVDALVGLRDSYREARQALLIARRLAEPSPLYFGDLNVYRLLFQLEHSPELASFCKETIGSLVEYDRDQGTGLVETLTAYFAHKGNLSRTAQALFVHRNTLLYRMERIHEISGLDLDNPETRLSIQLALRAYRLLTARDE